MTQRIFGRLVLLVALGQMLAGCTSVWSDDYLYSSSRDRREESCMVLTGNEREECMQQARVPQYEVKKRVKEAERSG